MLNYKLESSLTVEECTSSITPEFIAKEELTPARNLVGDVAIFKTYMGFNVNYVRYVQGKYIYRRRISASCVSIVSILPGKDGKIEFKQKIYMSNKCGESVLFKTITYYCTEK
jgi:hypothetical protein